MQHPAIHVVLVALTAAKGALEILLPANGQALPRTVLENVQDPDDVARGLAQALTGTALHVARHAFLTNAETGAEGLLLVYRQLLSPEDVSPHRNVSTVPLGGDGRLTDAGQLSADAAAVQRVVEDIQSDLEQVMHSTLNKRGLLHLLELLPEIFDHKELAAAYLALTGEKPTSPLMLARMMLDNYVVGSGEKAREVNGRNLIAEYDQPEPELLGEKWERNKDLYRTGGPKAKVLYQKK
jgi:hypothetical protein